jgi:hypothetical protein
MHDNAELPDDILQNVTRILHHLHRAVAAFQAFSTSALLIHLSNPLSRLRFENVLMILLIHDTPNGGGC